MCFGSFIFSFNLCGLAGVLSHCSVRPFWSAAVQLLVPALELSVNIKQDVLKLHSVV